MSASHVQKGQDGERELIREWQERLGVELTRNLDPNQPHANRFPLTCTDHGLLFYPEAPDPSHDGPPPCDEPAVYRVERLK